MSTNAERLSEEIYSQLDVTVDREEGTIRGAMLCQANSRNKRTYSSDALVDLAKLYENVPIRLEHDKKEYLSTVGAIQNVKYNRIKKQITGDLSLNKGHANYEQIMEDAERRPHLLALSHEVPPRRYEAHRDGELLVVDRVHHVDCMAIVTDPGVNKTLFEGAEDPDMDIKTAGELKSANPALYEEVRQEGIKAAANDTKLAEAIAERDKNVSEVERLTKENKKLQEQVDRSNRIDELRKKSCELGVQCSEELMEALCLLDSDEKVEAILKNQPKLKEESPADDESEPDDKRRQRGGVQKPSQQQPALRGSAAWLAQYANKS